MAKDDLPEIIINKPYTCVCCGKKNLKFSEIVWLEDKEGQIDLEQYGKPSLTCDVMELFRSLADDFLIGYSESIKKKDIVVKSEKYVQHKAGKREYLSDAKTRDMRNAFYAYLEQKVEIPRIKHGNSQSVETLISEEALLLAEFLRNERKTWTPRIPKLT